MNPASLISSLERTGPALVTLARSCAASDRHWRPAEGQWSIHEIVGHLLDEETDDFRARLRFVLFDRTGDPPGIDPAGWVVSRNYAARDFDDTLHQFQSERRASLEWMRGLEQPDWNHSWTHPKAGPLHAGDLLGAWAAHDVLHLRQLTKRLYQLVQRDAGQYSVQYAGDFV